MAHIYNKLQGDGEPWAPDTGFRSTFIVQSAFKKLHLEVPQARI